MLEGPIEGPKWKRLEFVVTALGEPAVRCFIESTSDGFVFGIASPKIGDVHLTVFFRDGKIRTHIKDSARSPAYVLDRTFTPDILGRKVASRIARLVKTYHPNSIAYVMRPALRRKLNEKLTFPTKDGAVEIPWEVVRGYVLVDLKNKQRWRRVKIRDLLELPQEFGFRVEDGRLYLVRPIDSETMLRFTEGQAVALDRLFLEYFGFLEYGEYVKARLESTPVSG